MQTVDSLLNGSDATAKIRSLEASGDLNNTLKVFAPDFRLACFRDERGQRAERGRAPGGTGDQGIAHAVERRTALLGKADANRIGAIIQNHGRCRRLAFQDRGGVQSDFLGREPGARSDRGIHLVRNGRTAGGVFDAVQHVHDRVSFPNLYLADRIGNLRSRVSEKLGILRKEFYDNGLGGAGEIANHVPQNLDELHFGGGFRLFDLRADIGHDLFDVALAVAFQFDSEVTFVGFGDGSQAQSQTGAARCVLNFWHRAHDLFDVQKDAIGFNQRAPWRSVVIENEAAFVHFGQKLGTEQLITNKRKNDDDDGTPCKKKRAFENRFHRTRIEGDNAAKETGEVGLFGGKKSGRVVARRRFACSDWRR